MIRTFRISIMYIELKYNIYLLIIFYDEYNIFKFVYFYVQHLMSINEFALHFFFILRYTYVFYNNQLNIF